MNEGTYKLAQSLLIAVAGLSMTACATWFEPQDGPPTGLIDINGIEDAVPRAEPLSRSGNPESYEVFGERYAVLDSSEGYQQTGVASWYGSKFHGRLTASGEPYDMYAMTAAHKTLPLPTYVQVTNLNNQRQIIVKVNDRGPFHDDRIIDLSYAAALKLGVTGHGTARVAVQALPPAATKIPASEVNPLALAAESPRFFVQLGAFAQRGNAERIVAKLPAELINPAHIEEATSPSGQLYRVRIGPFAQRLNLEETVNTLKRWGYADLQVVVEP